MIHVSVKSVLSKIVLSKIWCLGMMIIIAGTTGCGPKSNVILEGARTAYSQARSNPDVLSNAPDAMQDAEAALKRAEHADDKEEMERMAYLAQRKVQIAVAVAEREMADKRAESLTPDQKETSLGRRTGQGIVLSFGAGLFASGKAALKPGAAREFDKLVAFLKQHSERNVRIEGHTDSTGSDTLNLSLSKRRADAVRRALIAEGISGTRITTKGYGETRPVADNTIEAGRRKNRRVEVIILDE